MAPMRWLLLVLAVVAADAPRAATGGASDDGPALRRMHREFVDAFVDSQGFGKRRVTPMMTRMRHYGFEGFDEEGRCVLEVELVGVARHDPPVVHGATFMGFQHRDGDDAVPAVAVPVRGLQAWEREAVAGLVAGREMVVRATPRGIRAMGPIRARRDCLACHRDHREGDVLGALSYGLGHLVMAPEDAGRRSCRP